MMASEPNSSKSRQTESEIEKLKQDLYRSGAEGVKIKQRSYLQPNRGLDARTAWESNENITMTKKKTRPLRRFSIGQKIFMLSFLVFLFSAGFAFMTFYQSRNTISSQNIIVAFDHVAFVDGGEELEVSVDVTNNNHAPLVLTQVVLEYPSVNAGNDLGLAREVRPMEMLRPGETKTAEFSVVMYGQQGTQKNMRALFQYQVEGSNATFEKSTDSLVTLRSTPVDIVVTSRQEIISQQSETYEFNIISQSNKTLQNILFELDTPPGFEIKKAEPASVFGVDVWALGSLEPLEQKTITITGVVNGQEGESKTLRAFVGSGAARGETKISTVYNTISQTINLVQPFILADIYVGRTSDDVVSIGPGQKVSGAIEWRNTLDEAIKSPEITLYVSGSAFDPVKVEAQSGFYSSSDGRIIWSKETLESLGVMEPGETGRLMFSLSTVQNLAGLSRPKIDLRVAVKGIDGSGNLLQASQSDIMSIQIGTSMDVLTESLYASGPFANTGPLPPRAGDRTTYTVRWTANNSSSAVERARVTANLPPYVSWVGQTSPATETIRYDETSRMVVWDLGTLNPTSGFAGRAREAYFQVQIIPSSSQAGNTVDLTSRVDISGTDTFTGQQISGQSRSATTRLLNEGTGPGASGRIVE